MAQNKRRKMDLGAACSSVDDGEPQIAQQTAVANDRPGSTNKNENIFDESKDDFREAVKWSGFVDRSDLIKELMSKPRIVMIFAPRRFGKSMNVNMVKCFFEIEKGRNVIEAPQNLEELNNLENFKAFNRYGLGEPCQILNEENLVKEHFGRHPVVLLNFKCFNVSSIEDVEYSVKELVHFAYQTHSYLKIVEIFSDGDPRNEDANKYCKMWCDPEKYKIENAKAGLKKLIEYLHEYHKRKVYLLVDEFDAPVVDALLEKKSADEVTKISTEITKLLGAVVKGEVERQHLLGSLITGVSYLGGIGISEHLNNVHVYKWLLDNEGRFVSYYGLSDEELTTILKNVFPKDDDKRTAIQNEVKELYNGYNFKNQSVYSLWSVLHYIKKRSTLDASEITQKSFWGRFSLIRKMGLLLKHTEFMDAAIKLMDITGDGYISFSPCDKVDAQILAKFLNGDPSFKEFDIAFSFFMEQGYLTRDHDRCATSGNGKGTIYVKIPNVDILVAFEEMFQNFCIKVYGFSDWEMRECVSVFENFPKETDDVIFKEKLKTFYDRLRPLLQKCGSGTMDVNERSLQAVLFGVMLKTGYKINLEKIVEGGSTFGKIDIFWIHDTFLGIMELKVEKSDNDDACKKTARKALEEILTGGKNKKVPYVKILEIYPDVKNYLLIGFCMNKKCTPHMCCLVNSKNLKDCITYIPKDD